MKGLKKVALASAIAAISAGAQAELKALDDSAMGELTGQAGLTIDIETQLSIGEFTYVDAGAVVFKDIYRGGHGDAGARTMLDNIRLTLDVAGATPEGFHYGMSEAKGLAAVHSAAGNTSYDAVAAGVGQIAGLSVDTVNGHRIDDERLANDGDLVLHLGFSDAWQQGGGFTAYANGAGADGKGGVGGFADIDYVDARDIATRAVDFQFEIGQIALAGEDYAAGVAHSGTAYANGRLGQETILAATDVGFNGFDDTDAASGETTTLISDLKIRGYLGPVDILIQNNGNGFGEDGSYLGANLGAPNNGTGNANSKILWDTFVKVTDLDLYIDIAGVRIEDVRIHNERGDLTSLNTVTWDDNGTAVTENTSAFGFAHSKREIYAVRGSVLDVKGFLLSGGTDPFNSGIAINTQFKGDMDIGAIKFGTEANSQSIGSLHFTDIQSTTNWTISAH